GKHIPGPQLPLVLILPVSVTVNRFNAIEIVADPSGPFLREPGLAGIIEQPANVQTGLIAVIVNGSDSRKCIDRFASTKSIFFGFFKNIVQVPVEIIPAL